MGDPEPLALSMEGTVTFSMIYTELGLQASLSSWPSRSKPVLGPRDHIALMEIGSKPESQTMLALNDQDP